MLTLHPCTAISSGADFWLYAGEIVIATLALRPRAYPGAPRCRRDQAISLIATLPTITANHELSLGDKTQARYRFHKMTDCGVRRELSIAAVAAWLAAMGVNPEPVLELAAEKGWEETIITAARHDVDVVQAHLPATWRQTTPFYAADYLVLLLEGGVIGEHAYLSFDEALWAVQAHCDAHLPAQPVQGEIIYLSDESGDRDAWAYPLYPYKPQKPQLAKACPVCGSEDVQWDGYQVVRVIEGYTDGERWNYEIPDGPTGQWTELSGYCSECQHEWQILPAGGVPQGDYT